jgi:exonuclease I
MKWNKSAQAHYMRSKHHNDTVHMVPMVYVTFRIMPPPVEWPKQKHGRPGFSAESFLRYIFYIERGRYLGKNSLHY